MHSQLNGYAGGSTQGCLRIEGALADQLHRSGNSGNVAQHDNQRKYHISDGHKGHDHLRNLGNALNTTQHHQCHTKGDHQAADHGGPSVIIAKQRKRHMGRLRIKEILHGRCNTVNLGKGADTKETDTNTKHGKQLRQPLPLGAHALFYVVERATQIMAVVLLLSVLNGQKALAVLGGHTEEGGQQHPQQCTGTTQANGRSHAYDIAGTNGGGQRRAQRAEGSNLSLAVVLILNHKLQCLAQVPHLNKAGSHRQPHAGG